jgi:hypothetical protein
MLLTGLSVAFSYSEHIPVWLIGQGLGALSLSKWFVLLCDFSDGVFFKNKVFNVFWGYVSSLFCLVPFGPWMLLQQQPQKMKAVILPEKPFARWIVRGGVPLYALKFSLQNLWNYPRLFKIFDRRSEHLHFVLTIVVMQLFFLILIPLIPSFWKIWGLAYVLFLFLVDPLLRRRHLEQEMVHQH